MLLPVAAAMAEQTTTDETTKVFSLGVVEVSSSAPIAETSPLAETVAAEEIQRFNRYDVGSAINLLPGVTLQNLGARNERLAYVRGFNSRQVPLFIDGIPVYVPYDGNVDLNRFTTFDIGEIVVNKGFASVLYGPNTLGGAINLVSRRPTRRLEGNLGTGVGFDSRFDYNFYQGHFNVGTNQGTWYAQGGFSYLDRPFFRLSDDFVPVPGEDGGRRDNSGNTDYKGSFKIGYTPNATDEYAISYYNQNGRKDTPPYAGRDRTVTPRFWRWPYWDKESVYFVSRTGLGDGQYLKTRLYYDTFKNALDSYDDARYATQRRPFSFASKYDDYTFGAGLEWGSTFLDQHLIKAAFSYKQDVHHEIDDVNRGTPLERYADQLFSFGLEDTIALTGRLKLSLGVSHDRQDQLQARAFTSGVSEHFPLHSRSALNGQGGLFFEVTEDTQLHAYIARKTRFPTIKDRYSYRLGSAIPNPALVPEDTVNYEVGFDSRPGRTEFGASFFYSDLSNAIDSVTIAPTLCSRPPCFQLQNIGKAEYLGSELYATYTLDDQWKFHTNYTYLERHNRTHPNLRPLDTPRHKVFAYLEYGPWPYARFIASAEYNSSRFSSSDGRRRADAFLIGNLKAVWQMRQDLEAELGVNNVSDENYAYEEGFPEPGRNFFANANFRF
ncbi:TonB-dependent receptor plug domain-containing protein [Candidatus Methylocalor cossyra]